LTVPDPNSVRAHFAELMVAGVERQNGSPGYNLRQGPRPKHFLGPPARRKMFRAILSIAELLALQRIAHLHGVLDGYKDLTCTPGACPPSRSSAGRNLLPPQDGYADSSRS